MAKTLRRGDRGEEVKRLQRALKNHGFNPGLIDGEFGGGTEAALLAFQTAKGLLADGVCGSRSWAALADEPAATPAAPTSLASFTAAVTLDAVSQIFFDAHLANVKRHLPVVLQALDEAAIGDRPMVLMALATIRAESAGFRPIDEGISRFNSSPNGHPFDLYDNRHDLGNQGRPDGDRYKGRGFIQLTGRDNYRRYGPAVALDLEADPDRANDPAIAAALLARFLKDKELAIKAALLVADLRAARRLVNGGSHGLDRFSEAYRTGDRIFPPA